MTALAEPYLQRGGDPLLVRNELMYAIKQAIANHPRSQQAMIGPSEIGHPCARRIGYKLLDHPETNSNPDRQWKATIGTAVHSWLEAAIDAENADTGTARYVTEQTVYVGDIGGRPVFGHCDLYDATTAGVLDWKIVGATQLRDYRANGPGRQYRTQDHLYGRGWQLAGRPVDWVGIMFLPRTEDLDAAVWWTEPYDEQVASDALQRAEGIHLATAALGPDALPQLPTADAYCNHCPFFRAGSSDPRNGCPGDPGRTLRTSQPALTLITP